MLARGFVVAVVAMLFVLGAAAEERAATTLVAPKAELGYGGKAAVGYGGKAALGYGGKAALGYGGKSALGYGGKLDLGYGGKAALGYGGKAALGYGGKSALGYGGKAALGYGGKRTAFLWGQLNPRLAGGWARTQAMKRGYLQRVMSSVQARDATFAERARTASAALNAAQGSCGGLWPNLRVSLATVLAAAAKKPGTKLDTALSPFTNAVGSACAPGGGGVGAVQKALESARKTLAGKATKPFLRALSTAASWLKKPSLWKPSKKAAPKR